MSTEVYGIEIQEDGSRVVKRNLEELADTAEKVGKSLETLKKATGALEGTPGKGLSRELKQAVETLDVGLGAVTNLKKSLEGLRAPGVQILTSDLQRVRSEIISIEAALGRLTSGVSGFIRSAASISLPWSRVTKEFDTLTSSANKLSNIGGNVQASKITATIQALRKEYENINPIPLKMEVPWIKSSRSGGAIFDEHPIKFNAVINESKLKSEIEALPIVLKATIKPDTEFTQWAKSSRSGGAILSEEVTSGIPRQAVLLTHAWEEASKRAGSTILTAAGELKNAVTVNERSFNKRPARGFEGVIDENFVPPAYVSKPAPSAQIYKEATKATKELTQATRELPVVQGQQVSASEAASSGLRRFSADGKELTRTTKEAHHTVAGFVRQLWYLRIALEMIAGFLFLRQLREFMDSWIMMTNTVRLSTSSLEQAGVVQEKLFEIAQKTRQPIDDIATLYRRTAMASNQLGASQNEMLKFVEGVGMALVVQGTTAEKARGSLLQLGQMLGMGKVRMQEFTSISENAPRILMAMVRNIDEKMVPSIGALRRKLEEQNRQGRGGRVDIHQLVQQMGIGEVEISSKVLFDAFLKGIPEMESEFGRARATIGQGFNQLSNAIRKYIGELNEAYDISNRFNSVLGWMANNLDTLAKSFTLVGTTIGFFMLPSLAKWALGARAVVDETGKVITAATGLRGAWAFIAANPFWGWLAVLAAVTLGIYLFRDSLIVSKKEGISLGDVFSGVWNRVAEGARTVWNIVKEIFGRISSFFDGFGGKLYDFLTAGTTIKAPQVQPQSSASGKAWGYRPEAEDALKLHKFGDQILEAAKIYDLDAHLIAAVMQRESRNNPNAVSPKGAYGLMQLMPGTAKDLGVNRYDVRENIQGGTKYLRQLVDQFNGDAEVALASYNWGPHRKLLNTGKKFQDMASTVNSEGYVMPRETRNYPGAVLSDYQKRSGLTPQTASMTVTEVPGWRQILGWLKDAINWVLNFIREFFEVWRALVDNLGPFLREGSKKLANALLTFFEDIVNSALEKLHISKKLNIPKFDINEGAYSGLLKNLMKITDKSSDKDYLGKAWGWLAGQGQKIMDDARVRANSRKPGPEATNLGLDEKAAIAEDLANLRQIEEALRRIRNQVDPVAAAHEKWREELDVIRSAAEKTKPIEIKPYDFNTSLSSGLGFDQQSPLLNPPKQPLLQNRVPLISQEDRDKLETQVNEHWRKQAEPLEYYIEELKKELEVENLIGAGRKAAAAELQTMHKLYREYGGNLKNIDEEKVKEYSRLQEELATRREISQEADRLYKKLTEASRVKVALPKAAEGASRRFTDELAEEYNQGGMTGDEFNSRWNKFNQNLGQEMAQSRVSTGQGTFLDGMITQFDILSQKATNWAANFGAAVAKPIESAIDGISSALGRAIIYADNLGDAFMAVAREAVASLITGLINISIRLALNAALGNALATAASGAAIGLAAITGTAIASAYSGAAATVSLATMGMNAAPAMAGMLETFAQAKLLALAGSGVSLESGGYTGNGGIHDVAGVVHGQEFVMNAAATAKYRPLLERLNKGTQVTTGGASTTAGEKPSYHVTVNNHTPANVSVRKGPTEEELVVMITEQIHDQTPRLIENHMSDPNSRIAQAVRSPRYG